MGAVTEREQEILELVRQGVNSPTDLAQKLGISQAGASQALQRLARKGQLVPRRAGRRVLYDTRRQHRDTELFFLAQAYNALSQVWAYLMSLKLSPEELRRAREARDTLERILARKP